MSYVINNGPRPVAASTRERVLEAIEELGYRPNTTAQSLRTSRTGTLGLLVPDLTKSFFAELAAAVERAALAEGRRLLISSAQFSAARELEQVQAMLDANVDAVALTPTSDPTAAAGLLDRSGVPWVLLHRHRSDSGTPARREVVGADRQAGRAAAGHLMWHGHIDIVCLSGPEVGSPVHERTEGFRDALTAGGLAVQEDLVVSCGYAELSRAAYDATAELLQRRSDVTALCATTDEHALGVYRAAAEAGRRIGRDLAVVSIDGTTHTEFLSPPLTVMALPLDEVAARVVHDLLDAAPQPARQADPVPLQLVIRRSCGCGEP